MKNGSCLFEFYHAINFKYICYSDTLALPFDGDNNKIQTFGTPFNNLNIDLVPYVQNSAIFIGKSDNFSDTTYANASGKYIRLSAWYSIL